MSQIKVGHWEEDGGAVYIDCGFQPDFMFIIEQGAASGSAIFYPWFRELCSAATPKDGWSITDGTDAELADGSGFAPYDTGSASPTVTTWAATTNYALKTSDATLCYVRPTTTGSDEDGNTADRDAIFECTTDGGSSGSSEPAWPVEIGGTVTDGSVVWTKVNVATKRKGYQGFSVAAALQTDGQEMWCLAIQADSHIDHEDVSSWAGGIDS